MSARPIDLKTALPKTQQLARLQQQQNNMHRNDMHNHVINTNNQVEKRLKKVTNSEKASHKKITKDKHNKDNSRENHSQTKEDSEENKNSKKKNLNKFLGNNIDIKI